MKSVHLVGFIIKKFVTMHGHMNQNVLSIAPLYGLDDPEIESR